MTGIKYYVATGALLASVACQAANTASLTVIGKVTPPACSVTLAGGGVVNFLTMSLAQLQAYQKLNGVAYVVPARTVGLTVTCQVLTPVALNLSDNVASTKPAIDSNDAFYYGLGLAAGKQIGAYSVNFSALLLTTSGPAVAPLGELLRSLGDNSNVWSVAGTLPQRTLFNPQTVVGFRYNGTEGTPAPLTLVSGNLTVTPMLLITTAESSLATYDLAGSSTLSVIYQ